MTLAACGSARHTDLGDLLAFVAGVPFRDSLHLADHLGYGGQRLRVGLAHHITADETHVQHLGLMVDCSATSGFQLRGTTPLPRAATTMDSAGGG
jgi:hypothetical protein